MSRHKLDADEIAPAVVPYLLVTLSERMAVLGIAPARLCAGLGFDVTDLRDGVLVSHRQAGRMIRRALQLSGCADLGLRVGQGQALANFGLLGQALVVAPDVGTALSLAVRHYPAGGALVDVVWLPDEDGAWLALRPRLRDPRVAMFLVEEILSSVLELFAKELGEPLALAALELAYPIPAHAARYATLFGCTPRFDAARNRCRIGPDWLARPMPRHDPVLFAQLVAQLEQYAGRERLDTVAAVERLLERPGQAALSVEQVAVALDLSPRTLRRRLVEADTSFRAISERLRARAAQALLGEGLTVAAAGARLGFSDARAFRRACKRWLGQTPGGLRASP